MSINYDPFNLLDELRPGPLRREDALELSDGCLPPR